MNPIDHPLGGGEGKSSGGRHPCSPWGVPTKGHKTRKKKPSHRWDRHDRVTAIAALACAPWAARIGLYYTLVDHNARTSDFVTFIRDVHSHLHRNINLVCDRLPAHRAAVQRVLHAGATWLTVEWLPPYAPDLDPVENVWNQSKYIDLANIVPDDIHDLRRRLTQVLETYRHEPNQLHSFFASADLTL